MQLDGSPRYQQDVTFVGCRTAAQPTRANGFEFVMASGLEPRRNCPVPTIPSYQPNGLLKALEAIRSFACSLLLVVQPWLKMHNSSRTSISIEVNKCLQSLPPTAQECASHRRFDSEQCPGGPLYHSICCGLVADT